MDPFMGQIMQVGFNYAPPGWSTCQGQLLGVGQNSALFALLGVTFGGNGSQNFALPNAQSRVMIGAGQGQGLSSYTPGQMAGAEQVTMTMAQLPAHNHALNSVSGGLQVAGNNPSGNTTETPSNGAMLGIVYDSGGSGSPVIYVPAGTSGINPVTLAGLQLSGVTNPTGSSQPVPTLPPYLAVTTIIALTGMYPSRQ